MEEETKKIITKYVLQNAVKFNGNANSGAIISKVIGEEPELKDKAKELMKEINNIVKEINSLNLEEQRKRLEKIAPELLEEKEAVEKQLPELSVIKGQEVIMRFEPSPSGPLHIGHAYVLGLNALYCRKYNGKLILRISDTNQGNIAEESYELIPEDARWLTDDGIAEVVIQSNNMDDYYEHALMLMEKHHAYVCQCSQEDFKTYSLEKEECPCRKNSVEQNIKKWHAMFDESKVKEGEAVVRLKTDMKHPNPAMRDFPLLRINDDEHPRHGKKYRVWPLMNFSVAVDDHTEGITHILRAKDHADNAKRQRYIFEYLDWSIPETLFVGRINFKGLEISCSKTRKLIEDGTYSGWDDIRLPFLLPLRKRGYRPEAFLDYAEEVGVTLNDKSVEGYEFFKHINSLNKKIIEEKADRYFFVEYPVEIEIENCPEIKAELDLHPDLRRGGRVFQTKGKFLITKHDFENIPHDEIIRLIDLLNFKKIKFKEKGREKEKFVFVSEEYEDYKKTKQKGRIIHWLPADEKHLIDVKVIMDDKTERIGKAEPLVDKLKEGDIVQFERFGFCRLENEKENIFWFGHK